MPRYVEIVSLFSYLRPFFRLNSAFKHIFAVLCRGQRAVLALIRHFLVRPLHHVSPPDKVAPNTSVRDAFSHDTGITLTVYTTPAGGMAPPAQNLTPSLLSPECSTIVVNNGISQSVVQHDIHLNDQVKLTPFSPEELGERRNITQGQIEPTEAEPIPPVKVQFTLPEVEGGWTRHIHPEGSIYYQNESTAIRLIPSRQDNRQVSRAVLTRCDLSKDKVLQSYVTVCSNSLYKQLWERTDLPLFDHIELVLDIVQERPGFLDCRYYFVDHSREAVFWLCEYRPSQIYYYVKGVQAEDHIRLAIEAQYWYSWLPMLHCELFPPDDVDMNVCQSLRETLLHSLAEVTLSESALAPFTATELQQMLELTTKIVESRENIHSSTIQGPGLYVIARMKHIFTRMKFINFHGQVGARLNADQSLYVKENNDVQCTSHWFHVVNMILLSAPHDQLEDLKSLWVDHTINLPRWRKFVTMQTSDLAGFSIYSTVMLTVNVGFLAIPGVINSNQLQTATPMMIPIYISTMCSVGSLASALLLSRQSRGQSNQTADEAAAYMLECAPSKTHMEFLAVVYSLPISLIMWGMIAFVVALCITVFSLRGVKMQTPMAFCFALVTSMALSPVLWRWQRQHAVLDRRSRRRLSWPYAYS